MALVKYERKFKHLSKYATNIVDTEQTKARKFELGLYLEIG